MILLHGTVAGLSQAATGSLVAAIWQGILLAAAAALGLRLLPKTPAAVRFAIWFCVFLLVCALPFVALWSMQHTASATALPTHAAWFVVDERWCLAIAGVWAIASLIRAATLIAAALRVRALWKRATPIAEEVRYRSLTGLRSTRVCTSSEIDRPTVIGFFSPKILIPDWLLEKLRPAELEHVVLHEAGHLGRADDWMNLLQKIALVIFPLNPALAWVERRLCFERELACDERVLQATGAPKTYAECLATLAQYRLERRSLTRGLALVLGALGRESELARRVTRILKRGEIMGPLHAKLVLGGATLALLIAATGLERCPQIVGFAEPTPVPTPSEAVAAAAPRIQGYRVLMARADMHSPAWKSIGDAPPDVEKHSIKSAAANAVGYDKLPAITLAKSEAPAASAVETRASADTPAPAHVVKAVSTDHPSSTPVEMIVTRYTVTTWQTPDGLRVTRTVTQISSGQPASQNVQQQAPPPSIYPYAAVATPDGWVLVQL